MLVGFVWVSTGETDVGVTDNATLAGQAWRDREGRATRYQGQRVGGTVVVHSIKKHMWFLETATALLEGEDYTEAELAQEAEPVSSWT